MALSLVNFRNRHKAVRISSSEKGDVNALHTGTDGSKSPSTELEPAPKDSRAFVIKRPENSPEIPETPIITLKNDAA